MYSGGIDSNGVLYKVLTDMKYNVYDIHVHHVSFINSEKRHEVELMSTMNCLLWFRRKFPNRKILFTKNIMDFSFLDVFPLDADIFSFVAGQIFRSCNPEYGMKVQYVYFMTGFTKTDFENTLNFSKNEIKKKEISESDDRKKYAFQASTRTNVIIDACLYPLDIDNVKINAPERVYPVVNMYKKDIMKFLPKDLLALTWSCRTPVHRNNKYYECEKCTPCKQKRDI